MNNRVPPSNLRIISGDYLSIILIMLSIGFIGMLIFSTVTGMQVKLDYSFITHRRIYGLEKLTSISPFLILSIGSLITTIPVVYFKILNIKNLFLKGEEVTATITHFSFVKSLIRLEYKYQYDSKDYTGGLPIQKNEKTRSLEKQKELIILVNPKNPKKSIPECIF